MSTASTIAANTIVRRSQKVEFSRLDDDLFAIDSENGICYSLNDSAASVWELIEPPGTISSICSRLRTLYAVDAETCMSDVIDIVAVLRESGLVETEDEATA